MWPARWALCGWPGQVGWWRSGATLHPFEPGRPRAAPHSAPSGKQEDGAAPPAHVPNQENHRSGPASPECPHTQPHHVLIERRHGPAQARCRPNRSHHRLGDLPLSLFLRGLHGVRGKGEEGANAGRRRACAEEASVSFKADGSQPGPPGAGSGFTLARARSPHPCDLPDVAVVIVKGHVDDAAARYSPPDFRGTGPPGYLARL